MTLEFLQILVYSVFLVTIVAYATLDGFDFGVGILHLFMAKTDEERRIMMNSIGPVWDGNTTWIVVGGGVLFAGFPRAYGTLFTAFYMPFMILLFAYILRGVAIEFRSKRPSKKWRRRWDIGFAVASFLAALLFGLLIGNLIEGMALTSEGRIEGGIGGLLRPYPLLVALLALSLFTLHGATYLLMKTEGAFHERIRKHIRHLIIGFLVLWMLTTVMTLALNPHMSQPIYRYPALALLPLLSIFCIFMIPHAIAKKNDGRAFLFSCGTIFFLFTLFAIGTFPYFAVSTVDPEASLTLFNSSASRLALIVITIVSLTGLPLAVFYGLHLYHVFRGKVKITPVSY